MKFCFTKTSYTRYAQIVNLSVEVLPPFFAKTDVYTLHCVSTLGAPAAQTPAATSPKRTPRGHRVADASRAFTTLERETQRTPEKVCHVSRWLKDLTKNIRIEWLLPDGTLQGAGDSDEITDGVNDLAEKNSHFVFITDDSPLPDLETARRGRPCSIIRVAPKIDWPNNIKYVNFCESTGGQFLFFDTNEHIRNLRHRLKMWFTNYVAVIKTSLRVQLNERHQFRSISSRCDAASTSRTAIIHNIIADRICAFEIKLPYIAATATAGNAPSLGGGGGGYSVLSPVGSITLSLGENYVISRPIEVCRGEAPIGLPFTDVTLIFDAAIYQEYRRVRRLLMLGADIDRAMRNFRKRSAEIAFIVLGFELGVAHESYRKKITEREDLLLDLICAIRAHT